MDSMDAYRDNLFFSVLSVLERVSDILSYEDVHVDRQYKFNTIKLFMFVEILYIISLLSVTPHDSNFSADIVELPKNRREGELMDCLIEKGVEYRCAIEGYVNLTCYSVLLNICSCLTGSLCALHCIFGTYWKIRIDNLSNVKVLSSL